MKTNNVLLLELQPADGLGGMLRSMLEMHAETGIQLQQEAVTSIEQVGKGINELITRSHPAVIFLISPQRLLNRVKGLFKSLREVAAPPLVIVSDASTPDEIFEVIQLGAADYVTAPFKPTDILPRLWRLLDLQRNGEALPANTMAGVSRPLLGQSQAFLEAVSPIPLVAKCDASILISGETGTGKEVCAHAIHELSTRAARPFQAINCGAIPVELVENELFGHERGAYTHAATAQMGLIQASDGGTLFLDEIDSLPLVAQVKLLRFLQEKEFKPLGSTKTRHADVRIITATNVNVEKAVQEGRLRQDLYYRLNMIPILLPPLRERQEDIPLLAHHFLAQYSRKFEKTVVRFSPSALQKLLFHAWPGNVRELENVVARAVALTQHPVIECGNIMLTPRVEMKYNESFQEMKAKVVEQFERTYLQSLLIAHCGNITKAAEAAQKNRRAFFQLLRKHQINAEQFRASELD